MDIRLTLGQRCHRKIWVYIKQTIEKGMKRIEKTLDMTKTQEQNEIYLNKKWLKMTHFPKRVQKNI